MISKNYFTLFIKICLLLVFISSCKTDDKILPDCEKATDIYCNLELTEEAIIPYKLNDTIKLKNTASYLTYFFVQQKIDTGYTTYREYKGECPGNLYHFQYIDYTYRCSGFQPPLIISLYKIACKTCFISIYFDQLEYTENCSMFDWPAKFDTLNIYNRTYLNVTKFSSSMYSDTLQFAYYNTTEGILQIKSSGKTWYRVK